MGPVGEISFTYLFFQVFILTVISSVFHTSSQSKGKHPTLKCPTL